MLRAVLVGFILGFAMIGLARLSSGDPSGAHLTRASALTPGAAVDHVAQRPACRVVRLPRQILI